MVNPFNGEGIAYAMESGKFAAAASLPRHSARPRRGRERRPVRIPGRAAPTSRAATTVSARTFVRLIGNPQVMQACTRHGLPHPALMRFVLKLLANLSDPTR